ncbi:arginine--tRNA ligase [Nocardia takedensis]|uniref:arginine--tRNA ligase n=1 Tax=Nocardia takedensis TaxID=259390 RepID=UPI00030D15EF|nr:arginine--tRNA ligase [Nocardia takedensis]
MSAAGVVPLLDVVATAVSAAIARVRPEAAGTDPMVRRSDRADFRSDAALPLARRSGTNPGELAERLVAHFVPGESVERVAVSGPGFLNTAVADTALWKQVAARLDNPRLGVPANRTGQRVVVDYSGPNVAKEMHVGHLRTTIIGDSLVRVLGFLGAEVVRVNHLGDWGTQFGMLIQYLDEHPDRPWRSGESTVSALDGLYKAARARFDTDLAFADRARARVVALQSGDEATTARWREIVAESARAFDAIYTRLGVLLTADDRVGESFYNPMLPETVAALLEVGVAEYSAGAVVVASREVNGPDGTPAVLIAHKSDGGCGYDSTDLATLRHRVTTLAAHRLLYVTDSRQALHFRLVFEAAHRAGWLTDAVSAEHVTYGTILGPDNKPFKTRAGGTVRLTDLLDAAVAAAAAVVAEKNPDLPAADLAAIAEQAGIGAVKYADLSTGRVKDYVFDPVRMTAFSGNTGVYLQYAHARIQGILVRAGDPARTPVDPTVALASAERALVLTLDAHGAVIADVATTLEPHRLAGHLYDLARAFTAFYDTCPVLTAPEPVRANRLALCRLTAATLANGLDLLGIAAPTRM